MAEKIVCDTPSKTDMANMTSIEWTPETDKAVCRECDFRIRSGDIKTVPDYGSGTWTVCTNCSCPESFVSACFYPGCWHETSCGTPTQQGYVHTCGEHRPRTTETRRSD